MTTGQRTFSTAGRTVSTGLAPLPPGNYTGSIQPELDIGQADGPAKIPYVKARIAVDGTEQKEGGKKRLIFLNVFLSTQPGSDGVVTLDRGNGLTALAIALGTELSEVELITRTVTDENGKEVNQEYLDPQGVKAWLSSHAGETLKFRVKVKKGTGGYSDSNEIERFIAP